MSYDLSNVTVMLPMQQGTGWGNCGTQLDMLLRGMGAQSGPHQLGFGVTRIPGVLLSAVGNHEFQYSVPAIGDTNIGYGFIENDILARKYLPLAERLWDGVISGSSWMEDCISDMWGGDIERAVALQGVDPEIFKYLPIGQDQDYFVVGSFGKFEYRKAQDVVIRAMKLFMERHADVKLITAWHNPWPNIVMEFPKWGDAMVDVQNYGDAGTSIRAAVVKSGIPLDRWQDVSPITNHGLATYYRYCDVALFPNRCEAGTNLCLHEALACGLPCIAADATGQQDITRQSDYPCGLLTLRGGTPYVAKQGEVEVGNWVRPCLEEILSNLELAYRKRDDLRQSRLAISEFGGKFTWAKSAEQMASFLY